MSLPRVVMYSRPSCGLCDEAREVILSQRKHTPFEFEEVNVETDDALEIDYGIRIPVVLVDGYEAFEYRLDPTEFRTALVR